MRIFGEPVAEQAAAMVRCDSAEALRESVRLAEAAGCDELFLVPTTADVTELDRTREALGI
jgi:hypothetical protein